MKQSAFLTALLAGLFMATQGARGVETSTSSSAAPVAPALPKITALKAHPSSLTLLDGRDERRVLVLGKADGDKWFDLTASATLKPESAVVVIDKGYIKGKAKGKTEVAITAAGHTIKVPVTVENVNLPSVRFVRDVEPIISKAGCNQGTCHGSAKGKNGFKLSLRGYDPDYDYEALINDISGRRYSRAAVDDSLLLLKPIAEVPHEGRQAIKPGSREYDLLRQWLAEGASYEKPELGRAKSLEVLPGDVEIDMPGRNHQFLVIAHYADGTTRDVTREAVFTSNNGDVAEVKDGLVKAVRRGEAAVLVRYEGLYAANLVTVMGDRTGFKWSDVPESNFIDKHINAKLQKMKIEPSELCTDAEFIRRVSLDLTGLPPKPERVRAFLADKKADKRNLLIDELIGNNDFVDYWANKWADLLQCNGENLGQKGVWVYRQWIKQSISDNVPYDKMVRAVLTAEGRAFKNPAVNYFRVLREPGKITEDVSQTFLGVRFNCNKCHDHPFEKWTQNQYYQFGAYFAQVAFKRGALPGEEIVYRNYMGGEVKHLKTDMVMAPKVPVGNARQTGSGEDRRDAFVDWMTSKENPFFAKSMANRVWSYFFGKGIIDPVDDIRASNPASNPALLESLTDDFVKNGFDLRKLMRTICQSRTYQLSIKANKWNEDDKINFSHALPRRLSAEQLMDAVAQATGVRPNFAGMPKGMRAVEIPDGVVEGNDFLSLFGRPKRQSACECERTSNITLSHALNMINGVTVSDAVSSKTGKIAKIVEAEKEDTKVVEEIYLACLSRLPSEKEAAAIDFSSKGGSRLEIAQDLGWALLNSPAFLFNR